MSKISHAIVMNLVIVTAMIAAIYLNEHLGAKHVDLNIQVNMLFYKYKNLGTFPLFIFTVIL